MCFPESGMVNHWSHFSQQEWRTSKKNDFPFLSQADSFGMHFIRVSRGFQGMEHQAILIVANLITPFLFHSSLPHSCPWDHFKINYLHAGLCLRLYYQGNPI